MNFDGKHKSVSDNSGDFSSDENRAVSNTRDRLIEAIYSIVLEPHRYPEFMAMWEEHIESVTAENQTAGKGDTQNASSEYSSINRHLEIATALIGDLKRDGNPKDLAMLLNSRRHLCCLLVSGDCQMVWQNAKAIDQLQIEKPTQLADLYFSPASETSLKGAAGRLADAEPYTFLGIVVLKGAREETIVCAAVSVKESSGEALLLLSEVDRLWRREFSDFLRESFRLTDAEIEIVRQLVSGLTLNDIADQNSKSLNTVRTQLKTIQKKTGAKSQVEIVRLVSGLFSVIDAPISAEGINVYRDGPRVFTTSGGWSCPVHVYGPKEGTPVLFLHGMLDGCAVTGKFIDLLERQRLRLIAPERPHFGDADPDNGDIASAPQRLAQSVEQLLDRFGIRSTVVLGHMAGSVYAFASHHHLGDRIAGICNVSGGVPIESIAQIRSMNTRQRVVAMTAKFTPSLLPFIVKTGIRQLDMGGEEAFLSALYSSSLVDYETAKLPEIYNIITGGYHFSIRQGHKAFQTDSYHVVRDWSEYIESCDVPVRLIHGKYDPVVDIESVEALSARKSNFQFVADESAGQLVLHQNPDLIIKNLKALVDECL